MATRAARAPRAKKHLPVTDVEQKRVEPDGVARDAGHRAAFIEPERRRAMIAEAAYYRAEQRGFEPGYELEDWCAAESEIDTLLTHSEVPTLCGS